MWEEGRRVGGSIPLQSHIPSLNGLSLTLTHASHPSHPVALSGDLDFIVHLTPSCFPFNPPASSVMFAGLLA